MARHGIIYDFDFLIESYYNSSTSIKPSGSKVGLCSVMFILADASFNSSIVS